MSNAKKRDIWSDREVHHMLCIIKENHILQLLDSKTKRNKNIFENVAAEMAGRGIEKNAVQIRTKFKSLKLDYYKIKRNNNKSGAKRQTNEHFDLLDEILRHRPAVTAEGIDTSMFDLFIEETPGETSNEVPTDASYEVLDETSSSLGTPSDVQSPKPPMKTFQRSKKVSYQKAVETFSKEWKQSQKELMEFMKNQDAKFMEKEEDILKKHREETEKILERDRVETNKMISALMESMKSSQPMKPFFFQPPQSSHAYSFPEKKPYE